MRRPEAAVREAHRTWLASAAAQAALKRRKGLIEGVFGTLKTRHAGRQMLLRGLAKVTAEWTLLATAFNLQTLYRAAQGDYGDRTRPVLGAPVA